MPPEHLPTVKSPRSLESITLTVLIATIVVAIFAFIPSSSIPLNVTKSFVLAGGALLTLALYILARLSRGNIILPPLALIGALWLPVVSYALSAIFSGKPFPESLWGLGLEPGTLGLMIVVTILGTLTALVVRRPEHFKSFMHSTGLTFLVLVAIQLAVVIVGKFSPETISPAFSIAGSVKELAFILGLGVIGTLVALREFELAPRARRALIAGMVGALILIALANIELVWILIGFVSLGFFVESIMRRGASHKDSDLDGVSLVSEEPMSVDEGSRPLSLPLIVLAVSLFFIIGSNLGNALSTTFGTGEVNVRPSWESTFSVGRGTLSTAPAFGSGPGTFGVEWLKYRDVSLNTTLFWNVDFGSGIGFIPTSVVTTGLVGAAAWILCFLLLVILGLRTLILRTPEDTITRSVATFSFIASIYLFAISFFDLPSALVITLTFVFMGIFASTMRFARNGEQWGVAFSRSPRLGFIIVFALTIILLGTILMAYMLTERFIATSGIIEADVALSAGDLSGAQEATDRSLAFASSALTHRISSQIAYARLNEIAASTTMPITTARTAFQEALSAGITSALTASTLASSDYRNWLALGNLYSQAVPLNVEGAYENAKIAYERAGELHPSNPQIPYTLAQLAIAAGDTESADEYLKSAIALKQDYTLAIFLLSQLQVQAGNVDDALASALAAAYFTPNDPNILFQVGILYAAKNDLANAELALRAAVDANGDFANARYFLSAVQAKRGNLTGALEEMKAIAAISLENATAVETQLASLEAGKNPFPANLLSVSTPPVQ